MINRNLTNLAIKAHAAKPRKFVKVEDILAVCQKESGSVLVFNPSDLQYRQNLSAAVKITGIPATEIIAAVRITSGPHQGYLAKFRCEPGYWEWARKFTMSARDEFLLSCSFGVGQKMARWLVKQQPTAVDLEFVRKFMGDLELQLAYVAGDLDQLMIAAKGDKLVAFTRYNEGTRYDPVTKKPVPRVSDYGRSVDKLRADYAALV